MAAIKKKTIFAAKFETQLINTKKMKKLFLFASLVLALSLNASAQYKGFSFGLKFGPALDWTGSTTGAAINEGSRAGFGLGVVGEYYFSENYAIVTGVNVNLNRGHYNFNKARLVDSILTPYSIDRYYKSTVFEIPVMLKMVTEQFGSLPIRYYAQVGGGLGYCRRVLVKDAFDGVVSENYASSNKEFSNLRVSLKIGAGAQYVITGSTRVFAGLYFSHDFVNNINYIKPDHCGKYYNEAGEMIGKRDTKLNLLQNRLGLEVGILF